jgi:hypothetical protein
MCGGFWTKFGSVKSAESEAFVEFKITALQKNNETGECHLVGYGVGTKEDAKQESCAFFVNPQNSTIVLTLKKSACVALGIELNSILTLIAKPPEVAKDA